MFYVRCDTIELVHAIYTRRVCTYRKKFYSSESHTEDKDNYIISVCINQKVND